MKKGFFSEKIVEWYKVHHRDLPWRNTQEPYKIWLSEIILQQTRVIQGLPYYQKFILKYPKINLLAEAKEGEVLRLWQGLGYYTRARNLHKCAREIVRKFNGKFPVHYDELKMLPGIGDYTAAAIASFAYRRRVAVVDGNVQRLLSRVFGIEENVSSSAGKRYFFDLANQLISAEDPGLFNQAIMEFGALQCVPKNPACDECVLKKNCFARLHDQQDRFPVKRKPTKITRRFFYYLVIRDGKNILMNRRAGNDIWNGLYDFPLQETRRTQSWDKIKETVSARCGLKALPIEKNQLSREYKHILSHQILYVRFIQMECPPVKSRSLGKRFANARWYSLSQIAKLPKSVLISRYLQDQAIL